MPYIKLEIRSALDPGPFVEPESPGELNYTITCLVRDYFRHNGRNYQAINDIMGALEGAKVEFYRRVAAPYEDKKIAENGDVY